MSWWEGDPLASRNPNQSQCHEDKHKAPTLLHIRPLSLQDGGDSLPLHYPLRLEKFIRTNADISPEYLHYITSIR